MQRTMSWLDGIGKRLAELTGAEWGMVSCRAAPVGMKHVTAACVTGGNPEKPIRIPIFQVLIKQKL